MLTELSIADLGVIAAATIPVSPGFTAVTGETGAGKTMVVGSLLLVGGGKADQGLVRHGAERAVVTARFSEVGSDVAAAVDEAGGVLDDGELIVARQLTGTRSRAFVGGVGVPAATAASIVGDVVTVHGQSEQVRLSSPERQREVLDRACGPEAAAVLTSYREVWAQRRRLLAEATELGTKAQERNREIDLLRFGLDEIAAVAPTPGEDAALAVEARRLQDADDLRLAAHGASVALAGDEADPDAPSALAMTVAARKLLDHHGDDPVLDRKSVV